MYPVVLVIDANEERAQRVGRLLCLADYRPIITSTPYQAFDRALQEHMLPKAILLGQQELLQHHVLARLLSHFKKRQKRDIPLLPLPIRVSSEPPIYAAPGAGNHHVFSENSANFIMALDARISKERRNIQPALYTQIMNSLPTIGLQPRIAHALRSRNSHFHLLLTSAYAVIGETHWPHFISDVGLAQYQHKKNWPTDFSRTIPAEFLSCLHQAVAFSDETDAIRPLHLWSNNTIISASQDILPSLQQKMLAPERAIRNLLTDFTQAMNDIRGEDLYEWRLRPDGSYWIIHYSNLYAYGRWTPPMLACSAWIATFECMLRLASLDTTWTVSEKECACTTLTGHCLFVIQPKQPAHSSGNMQT